MFFAKLPFFFFFRRKVFPWAEVGDPTLERSGSSFKDCFKDLSKDSFKDSSKGNR